MCKGDLCCFCVGVVVGGGGGGSYACARMLLLFLLVSGGMFKKKIFVLFKMNMGCAWVVRGYSGGEEV